MPTGKKTKLRPAAPEDLEQIYQWLAHSDLTASMIGPPDFPDSPVPDWESFRKDYDAGFFTDDDPYDGRSFIIEAAGEDVGHINYNEFDKQENIVELDIWLSSICHCNKGYGTDAIVTLCDYLNMILGCGAFILAPSARNHRTVRAYKKAGFEPTELRPSRFVPDYVDTVVMLKRI